MLESVFVPAPASVPGLCLSRRGGYWALTAHLPEAIFDLADFGARIRYHYSLKDMRPVDSLDDNTIPILFIHGEEDSFILPKNSMDLAERTKGEYQLHLVPGAGHAESVLAAPEIYYQYVKEFTEGLGY